MPDSWRLGEWSFVFSFQSLSPFFFFSFNCGHARLNWWPTVINQHHRKQTSGSGASRPSYLTLFTLLLFFLFSFLSSFTLLVQASPILQDQIGLSPCSQGHQSWVEPSQSLSCLQPSIFPFPSVMVPPTVPGYCPGCGSTPICLTC